MDTTTGSDLNDEVPITAEQVLQSLENAWLNEKFSPEILPHQEEMVDIMLEQIYHMEINLSTLEKPDLRLLAHRMELERIRFIVASYLRIRLEKIETYTQHILKEEAERSPEEQRLTADETKFAKEFLANQESHMRQIAQRHMPGTLQNNDPNLTTIKPNMYTHVFLRANVTVPAILVPFTDDEIDLTKGSQHVMQYEPIAAMVREGSAQLI